MARYLLFAVAFVCVQIGAAHGARFEVRHAVNGSWIYVQGDFATDDGPRFERILEATRDAAVVVLESNGGRLIGGLDVGTAIRKHQLPTLVEDGAICASACAAAWLGGTRRYIGASARVGFHSSYTRDWRNIPTESRGGNALLGAYLNRMGVADRAVVFITEAAPTRISWLTMEDAKILGIDVLAYNTATAMPGPPRSGATAASVPSDGPSHMEQTAYRFPFVYFAQSGENPVIALDYFANVYSDDVTVNGIPIPRAQVLERKRKQSALWPEQAFTVRADSVRVQCDQQNRTCQVTGVVDWEWSNWGRGSRSSGSSNFSFQVAIASDGAVIHGELESVFARQSSGPQ